MTEEKVLLDNPLETAPIPKLLVSFCIPSLASNLVTCLYNIVDQFFIGNILGEVGNAATSVIFPIITLITALSLMCGVGPSNAMNIYRGKGDMNKAALCVGGGFGLMVICGFACTIPMCFCTEFMLQFLGCTDTVLPYAKTYAVIIALGFTFSIIGASGPFLIRADGSPKFATAVIITGAVLNIFLDALFIYGFQWGIAGAAWATVLSQFVSTIMVVWYMVKRFSAFSLKREHFKPSGKLYGQMMTIGMGPAFNFGTQAIVQVFLNNALKTYGAASIYGADACLAAAGVANKVNTLSNAMVTGLTNGLQPISSYNFGRKNYKRVAEASKMVVKLVLALGFVIFLGYQFFAVEITALFGEGSQEYFAFAEKFFRIFFLLIPLYGLQSSVAGFFSSQGKVKYSITISLVRQILFFPPLLILLPEMMGVDGILWAGPVADLAMALTAGYLFVREIKKLEELDEKNSIVFE